MSENTQKVIKELEEKGFTKAKEILTKPNSESTGSELLKFMKDGTKEFEERTGRKMTYSEMREAYG
jgi:hypothetical protein